MATPTPGTFPSFPPYQPGALTYSGAEILLLVNSATATAAATFYDFASNIVGKVPSILPVANPATGDLLTFFQNSSGLPKAAQIGNLGIPAGNLPVGGSTSQLLAKNSAVNFDTSWVGISNFVSAGTGIATSGSATALVISVTGPLTPTSYTANGVLYGQGTAAIGVTVAGTAGLPLIANGTTLAPSFAPMVLTAANLTGVVSTSGQPLVSNGSALAPTFQALNLANVTGGPLTVGLGGIGTTALASHGVALGEGAAALSVAPATTAGYPLVANGSATDPSFQALALHTANVTSQLPVTFGGIGTSALSSHGIPTAQGSAAFGVVAATTAGLFLSSQGTTSEPSYTSAITNITGGFGLTGTITTTGNLSVSLTAPPSGLDAPINLGLSASITAGTLVINFLNAQGNTPTATSPILVGFNSVNATAGTPAWVPITSALSISTFTTGATLGASSSSTPFRLWIVLFFQSASLVMPALINCSNTAQIFSLNESNFGTSFSIGSTATSAGVFYSPNGTTVGPSAFRIAGYVEYGGGLPTAGSYSSAPTALKVYSMGMKRPGDIVQSVDVTAAAATVSFTTVLASTNVSNTITPTASPNLIKYNLAVSAANNGAALFAISSQLYRNGSAIGTFGRAASDGSQGATIGILGIDAPGTTVSLNYLLRASTNGSTAVIPATTGDIPGLSLMEIMG